MKIDDRDAYTTNPRFGWRFFPKAIAREPVPCELSSEKSRDAYRIFILGGSTARGTPDWTLGFGRFLQTMLQQRYPGVKFEVVNAAMTAINSHVVLPIARDAASRDPDLFVVYMGNNEVVGPYGTGTVFADFSPNLTVIRASIYVKSTRIGQLVNALIGSDSDQSIHWKGMEMFHDRRVAAADPRLQDVYEHFRANLDKVCDVAHNAATPIVVCTVATNLKDSPPFASMHRPDLTGARRTTWENLVRSARTRANAGDHARAVDDLRSAAELDDRHAELHFLLGRSLLATKQPEKAREHFLLARDLDALRFRADTSINRIVRQVVANRTDQRIFLADVERAFEQTPHRLPGRELFYEHVHLNPEGNYLLAKTVFEQIAPILPEAIRNRASGEATFPAMGRCLAEIPLTVWDRYRMRRDIDKLQNSPPFTDQLDHESRRAARWEELKCLVEQCKAPGALRAAGEAYVAALERSPDSLEVRLDYAIFLGAHKDFKRAVRQWRRLLVRLPHVTKWQLALGNALRGAGKSTEAIAQFRETMRRDPSKTATAMMGIGTILLGEKRLAEAEVEFRGALSVAPARADLYERLGVVMMLRDKLSEAITLFRQALEVDPKLASVHNNLGAALTKRGDLSKAIEHYRRAIKLDPNYPKTYPNLATALTQQGLALAKAGSLNEARERYGEAFRIDPARGSAGCKYAALLLYTGQAAKAVRTYRKVLRRSPNFLAAANDLARILATHPNPELRDGADAVRILKACGSDVDRNPILLDTLARVS